MKKNLRGKIREFVKSEEGKVGVKSPLTLGVATGSVLLTQMIVGTPQTVAFKDCWFDEHCMKPEHCHNATPFTIKGTCH